MPMRGHKVSLRYSCIRPFRSHWGRCRCHRRHPTGGYSAVHGAMYVLSSPNPVHAFHQACGSGPGWLPLLSHGSMCASQLWLPSVCGSFHIASCPFRCSWSRFTVDDSGLPLQFLRGSGRCVQRRETVADTVLQEAASEVCPRLLCECCPICVQCCAGRWQSFWQRRKLEHLSDSSVGCSTLWHLDCCHLSFSCG